MNKTEMVRARMSPALKRAAEGVLQELGLSASEAITLFYTQLALRRKLPLDLSVDGDVRSAKTMTAGQILNSGAIGLWKDRETLADSPEYARALRENAENARRGLRS
jgi:DNA-damage-inducible protein J